MGILHIQRGNSFCAVRAFNSTRKHACEWIHRKIACESCKESQKDQIEKTQPNILCRFLVKAENVNKPKLKDKPQLHELAGFIAYLLN